MARARLKKSPPAQALSDESRHLWVVCALCAAGFLIYANSFASSFHFDDRLVIVNNPAIRHWWDIPALLNAFNTRVAAGWTFAVNYALGGLDVFGYHFFNVWLHVCNAVLIYAFMNQLGRDRNDVFWLALTASVIFLVHPVHTQAVNYIWQRTTLLASFFYLGTLVLYIQARRENSRPYYTCAMACCLAAMLSKEISFTLPVVVFMLETFFLRRTALDKRSLFWTVPFLCMLLIIPLMLQRTEQLTLPIMRPFDMMSGVGGSIVGRGEYWLTQVNAIVTYLRMFVWPVGLNIDHDYPSFAQSGWGRWLGSLALLSAFAAYGVLQMRRRLLLPALGTFWFFVTVALESLVTSSDFLVDHRLYLPSVGLCIIAALALVNIANRRLAAAILVATALTFSIMTFNRNAIWQNDISLWSDAIQKSPHKARGYNNRGIIYKQLNLPEFALDDFNRAIAIDPTYPEAYYNRGGVHKMTGNLKGALADYAKVIELEPDNYQGFDARGYIHRRQGNFKEALEDFNRSIALNPRNPEVYNNRAYIYQKDGRADLAEADYSAAINADPGYVYAYNNRGNLYLEQGKYEKAAADYTRAISLQPDFGEPYVNRAVAYFRLGRYADSRKDVDRARMLSMKINPQFLQELMAAPLE